MTTRIIIKNEGPDKVEVSPTGQPIYSIAPGEEQEQYLHTTMEVNIKEVKE